MGLGNNSILQPSYKIEAQNPSLRQIYKIKLLLNSLIIAVFLKLPFLVIDIYTLWKIGRLESFSFRSAPYPKYDSFGDFAVALALAPVIENLIAVFLWASVFKINFLNLNNMWKLFICSSLAGTYAFLSHGLNLHALPATTLFITMACVWYKPYHQFGFTAAFIYTVSIHFFYNLLTYLATFVFY